MITAGDCRGIWRQSNDFLQERAMIRERGAAGGLDSQAIESIFAAVDAEAATRLCGTPIWRNVESKRRIDAAIRELAQ